MKSNRAELAWKRPSSAPYLPRNLNEEGHSKPQATQTWVAWPELKTFEVELPLQAFGRVAGGGPPHANLG